MCVCAWVFMLWLIVVGQDLRMPVCVWVCAHIQYVCLPGHGLRSNKKAQERQAAGFQFGAVSCWMLCNEQKRQILVVCPFTRQVQLYCRKTVFYFFYFNWNICSAYDCNMSLNWLWQRQQTVLLTILQTTSFQINAAWHPVIKEWTD